MASADSVIGARAARAGPSAHVWYMPHLIAFVESGGASAEAIRRLTGLADFTDPDFRVPDATVDAAWQLAASLTGDEAVGVHVAEWLPRGALDLVEYAVRSSSTLAAGLECLARYGRVVSDRAAMRTEANADGLLLLIRGAGTAPVHRARIEFALALALKLARDAAGHEIVPRAVCFAHPPPEDTSEHRRFFGAPVRFGAGTSSMILDSGDAARPVRGADEWLSRILRRRLDKALAERERSGAGAFSDRVRELLVAQLGQATLTPAMTARALVVSPRTMSRRLAAEGTSYRTLLDEVRREFACALLQNRSLSVADVAFFLQYSEPAAFNRSFRRWTGLTPGAFRTA